MGKKMAQHLKIAGNINYCRSNSCGFSLLEVMLSAVILTVSLLGVAGMYGFSSQFSYEAKQHGLAVNISQHILNGIKINKSIWIKFLRSSEDNKKVKIIIGDRGDRNKLKLDQFSPVAIDIQSFRQHLNNAFSDGHACFVIELMNKDLSNMIDLDVNVNWILGANSTDDSICYISEMDKVNKNYHFSTIL
jgi:type IV pilus assembly protein PilV